MVFINVTYFTMTVYPLTSLARWSYPPAPGRYSRTPAWRRIVVIAICNHNPPKLVEKTFTTTSFTGILLHCIDLLNVVLVLWLQKKYLNGHVASLLPCLTVYIVHPSSNIQHQPQNTPWHTWNNVHTHQPNNFGSSICRPVSSTLAWKSSSICDYGV